MATLKLSSPWMIYYKEICAMFEDDSNVSVIFDEDAMKVKLFVEGNERAAAIDAIMSDEKDFGTVTLGIEVYPANYAEGPKKLKEAPERKKDLFDLAFSSNMALSFTNEVRMLYNNTFTYVVFRKEVVQYFNDDLGDAFGLCSTLYEEIARDIFKPMEGVYYCTDKINERGSRYGQF